MKIVDKNSCAKCFCWKISEAGEEPLREILIFSAF